jgi:hypothetical protein
MRIRLVGHSGEPVMNVGTDGPWREFVKELENNGCEIVKSDYGSSVDALIANCHSKDAINECRRNNVPKNKKFLILWEPKSVDYRRHSREVLDNYGTIWSPSLVWAPNSNTRYFNWPQLKLNEQNETINIWGKRENKASMVLANKFSATKGELYSLRRETALVTCEKESMDLYGDKWNLGKAYDYRHYIGNLFRTPLNLLSLRSSTNLGKIHKNFKGHSANKTQTTRKYRIIVVLENSLDYISEKLFDAFDAGAIVIYVGPDIRSYKIPVKSAIEVKANAEEINRRIMEIQSLPTNKQFEIMKEQQKNILSISESWHCNHVLKKLAADICKELKVQSN